MIDSLSNLNGFILVVLVGFILDWSAIYFNWQRIKPLTKVLAMVLLIVMTLLMSEWKLQGDVVLLLLAQVFGMGGDIFLLLSRKWFLWGLSSFLIGKGKNCWQGLRHSVPKLWKCSILVSAGIFGES